MPMLITFSETFWILIFFSFNLWTLSSNTLNHLIENLIFYKFAVLVFLYLSYLVTCVCLAGGMALSMCQKELSFARGRLAKNNSVLSSTMLKNMCL